MNKDAKLNVCLMFGGKSVEHDISIISALQVYHALNKDKYNIVPLYITKENKMLLLKNLMSLKTFEEETYLKKAKEVTLGNVKEKTYLKRNNKKQFIDVFIPVVHGEGTEDGTISSLLDFFNATYITSNHTSSSIAQDKRYTKDILRRYHINSPRYLTFKKTNKIEDIIEVINEKLTYPIIIKPSKLGSSIGISVAKEKEEVKLLLEEAFKFDTTIIVEEVIKDKTEFNCACFKYNNYLYTSNIEEVSSSNDILTFDDKYLSNIKEELLRNLPAKIDDALKEHIKNTTKEIYQILDFEGIIRVDYLYDTTKKRLYFNEVNTIPGSYAFYLFDQDKLPFDIILDMLIKEALLNKQRKSKLQKVFKTNVLKKKNKILKK